MATITKPRDMSDFGSMEADGMSPNQIKARNASRQKNAKAKPEYFPRQTLTAPTKSKPSPKKLQKSGRAQVKKPSSSATTTPKRYPRSSGSKSQQYNFSRKAKPELP